MCVVVVLGGLSSCSLPPGFSETTTHQALVLPTSLAFAPDGRMFVAEKRGTIQTYDSVDDTTPTQFADLREQVHSVQDRGLLGIEVDPAWPSRPYVYVLYSYDAPVGATAPVYGTGTDSDPCGPSSSCPAQGRVARLTAGPDGTMTDLKVLVEGVCFAFSTHGGGGIRMAPDGSLVAAFGDGAFYNAGGTFDATSDPCNDPPYEGGSLRAQDLRTSGDPTGLSGTVIRINPDTGAPWPTNPLIGSPDPEARKIVSYGVRNPYRLAFRPGTPDLWVADVGQARAEELNRINMAAPVENFGWPCYEGNFREPDIDALDRPICEALYSQGGTTRPYYMYCHGDTPPGQVCNRGGGAISGLAFYEGGSYPDKYDGALFFADYTRKNIRVMLPTNGIPDPTKVENFGANIGAAVDLRIGPGGDLFYADIFNGRIQRIYQGPPPAPETTGPKAIIEQPAAGSTYRVGDTIAFSGRASAADGSPLPPASMRWDLIQLHCPTEASCHRHFVDSREAVASGSFIATEHEQPSKMEIALTVTHNGRTDTSTVVLNRATTTASRTAEPNDTAIPTGPGTGFLQGPP